MLLGRNMEWVAERVVGGEPGSQKKGLITYPSSVYLYEHDRVSHVHPQTGSTNLANRSRSPPTDAFSVRFLDGSKERLLGRHYLKFGGSVGSARL